MELDAVMRHRRMVRQFDPDAEVDLETVHLIASAARRAPSAGHSQGVEVLVLTSPDDRERYWSTTTTPQQRHSPDRWLRGVSAAPALVLVLASPAAYTQRYAALDKSQDGARSPDQEPNRWAVPWWHVDAGMSAMLVLLAATDAGLGALFFGVPSATHAAVRAAFDVPTERVIIGAIALGHERADARGTPGRRRRPAKETIHHGRYGASHRA